MKINSMKNKGFNSINFSILEAESKQINIQLKSQELVLISD